MIMLKISQKNHIFLKNKDRFSVTKIFYYSIAFFLTWGVDTNSTEGESDSPYFIRERFEIGQLGEIFLPKFGQYFTYFCFAIYTYGTLSVYAVSVASSFDKVIGSDIGPLSAYNFILIIFAGKGLISCVFFVFCGGGGGYSIAFIPHPRTGRFLSK